MHLNGVTNQSASWPQPQLDKETIFLLPKPLNSDDNIVLSGTFSSDPKTFRIALMTGQNSPDYQNVACEMEVSFPSNNGNNKIYLKGNNIITNESYKATDFFVKNDFSLRFNVRNGNVDIYIEPSYFDNIQFQYNLDEIRYIAVSGDVEKVKKLDFEFS